MPNELRLKMAFWAQECEVSPRRAEKRNLKAGRGIQFTASDLFIVYTEGLPQRKIWGPRRNEEVEDQRANKGSGTWSNSSVTHCHYLYKFEYSLI